jgi:transposase
VPALKKARLDPAGECVIPSPAEPSLGSIQKQGEYDMAKASKSTFDRLTATNRKQRRKLRQQLCASDPGLTVVHPNAAGIDVGNESHYVAVPGDREGAPVQEFGCWTADLVRMCEWLQRSRIETVAMQATGVYWIPLYDQLTQHGIEVVVVNAQHTKNVPGRKTDVQEAQWLMKLHTYGLLSNSFQLQGEMEKVRTIWRLRDRQVKEATRAIQHMQKALTKMNIQLANVLSDISGSSGQAIIGAILAGERDPYKLADLKHERVRASREQVARSLEGSWREDVLFELQQAVEAYRFARQQMGECDKKLAEYLEALPARNPEDGLPEMELPAKNKAPRVRKPKGNAPAFDLKSSLRRVAGVDLTSIDGIDVMTAQTILAEVGTDLSAFRDEDHFASWLGLSPSKDISGGKVIRSGTRKVQNRVAMSLRMAATTLRLSDSYLGARYRHLCRKLPAKASAVKAMARYLALLVYRMLTKGQAWVDCGAARFEQRREQLEMAGLNKRAAAKGLKLVPVAAPVN